MKLDQFSYELPPELIAKAPLPNRRDSRLLHLNGDNGSFRDGVFSDLIKLIEPGDLLVFNNTQVIPARMFASKPSGGRVELLIERITSEFEAHAHVRASKGLKTGGLLKIDGVSNSNGATCLGRAGDLFVLRFEMPVTELMALAGHMPLPPYIDRADTLDDRSRYQTVYAERPGAVAAPTAGLHFDQQLLTQLTDLGVRFSFVTLHVGAGTFQPVRATEINEHQMHAEWLEVTEQVVRQIEATRAAGKRVIAVGTTSMRALETAAVGPGKIAPFVGDSRIFIYPGYIFRVVDALITNFHVPESTLLMLVSAFCGRENVLRAYAHAVAERYRFFSYGDAMFLEPNAGVLWR